MSLFATLLLSAPSAAAYECTTGPGGSPVWVGRCVPYVLEESDPLLSQAWAPAAVQAGFELWSSPACTGLVFVNQDVEGAVRVRSIDTLGPGDPAPPPGAVAVSELRFDLDTGAIVGGGLVINSRAFQIEELQAPCAQNDRFDLSVVIAAEAARLIGLDHSRVEGSIAARNDLACTTQVSLGVEDQAGVCAIYPRGEPVNPCVVPEEDYDPAQIIECPGVDPSGDPTGGPCTSDAQCSADHRCQFGRCQLILQSRGCACRAERGAPEGFGLWLLLLALLRAARSRA